MAPVLITLWFRVNPGTPSGAPNLPCSGDGWVQDTLLRTSNTLGQHWTSLQVTVGKARIYGWGTDKVIWWKKWSIWFHGPSQCSTCHSSSKSFWSACSSLTFLGSCRGKDFLVLIPVWRVIPRSANIHCTAKKIFLFLKMAGIGLLVLYTQSRTPKYPCYLRI